VLTKAARPLVTKAVGKAIVAFSMTTLVAGRIAYFQIFSFFAVYDDEGYLLITLKHFRQGLPLYDTVYSQYGPFYYGFFDLVFSALRLDVTHDAGGLVTVAIWATTSLLCGLVLFALTRSLWIGCATQLLTALALDTLRYEPMHPGGLICLVLGCIAVVALLVPSRPRLAWAALGSLGAALALTKINVGVFAFLAIGLVALGSFGTRSLGAGRAHRVLVTVAGAIVLLSPVLLMGSHYELPSVPRFIVHVTAALVPLVVLEAISPVATFMRSRGIIWMSCGAIGTVLVLVLFAILQDTTLPALWNVLIVAPLRHADVLFRPLELPPHSRKLALLGAVAGVAMVLRRRPDTGRGESPALEACLRLAAGLAMLVAVPGILPIRFGFYFAPLAWVAALPPAGVSDSAELAFARRLLPLLAVLQCLHAYPVARSHVQWGAFLLVPVAGICVFDGARQLGAWVAERDMPRASAVVAGAASVLLALLGAVPTVKTILSSRREYVMNEPLRLPGSERLRLPATQASLLRNVVRMVDDHECRTFIGAPGMGSFYFWAHRDPPTALIATRWGYLFDRRMQERVVRDIADVEGLCVIERGGAIKGWARESAVHPSPLCEYLLRSFVPVDRDGIYQLLVRPGHGVTHQ
jgi:hypothetical protein